MEHDGSREFEAYCCATRQYLARPTLESRANVEATYEAWVLKFAPADHAMLMNYVRKNLDSHSVQP